MNYACFHKSGHICDQVCENRSYLHKMHLRVHFIISISFCVGYTISVNSLRNFVYMMKFLIKYYVRKRVNKFDRLKIRSNFTCR